MKKKLESLCTVVWRGLFCILWILFWVVDQLFKRRIPLPLTADGVVRHEWPAREISLALFRIGGGPWLGGMSMACAKSILHGICVGQIMSARPTTPLLAGDSIILWL